MISRDRKILRISQAHVAPGMSLVKWRETLAAYGAFIADPTDWVELSDAQVDGIFTEIAGVVKAARAATAIKSQSESIEPVDLYRPH